MLIVKKVPGEATRFWVQSNSLECLICHKLWNRHRRSDLSIGGACPACGGQLDTRFHIVDIASYNLNGHCSCEYFEFKLGPEVCRQPPAEQGTGKWRCAHIEAARDFALDVALKCHDKERHANARGQREERQP